jgi:catechol 2,3-dioxygenase-like lactoylglutathione lyase family enzyme
MQYEPPLVPELSVSDFQKSLGFYTKVLGFKIEYDRPEKKFALLSFENSQIMINEHNDTWETGKLEYPLGRGVNFQIECGNVDLLIKKLRENNFKLFQEVEENWYRKDNKELGNREFLVQDPDGYLLRFAQFLGERDIR